MSIADMNKFLFHLIAHNASVTTTADAILVFIFFRENKA